MAQYPFYRFLYHKHNPITSANILLINPISHLHACRLTQSNYRTPRVGWNYQTTPFTIDPSARSTQTFAERYGISPPHSPLDDPYGANDYNGIEKDVDVSGGENKTTVIKDPAADAHQPNSKRFLPNSTSFDVELIPVS